MLKNGTEAVEKETVGTYDDFKKGQNTMGQYLVGGFGRVCYQNGRELNRVKASRDGEVETRGEKGEDGLSKTPEASGALNRRRKT